MIIFFIQISYLKRHFNSKTENENLKFKFNFQYINFFYIILKTFSSKFITSYSEIEVFVS